MKKLFFFLFFSLLSSVALTQERPTQKEQDIGKVLINWFDYDSHGGRGGQPIFNNDFWWQAHDEVDKTIRFQYKDIYQDAVNGKLNDWLDEPQSLLAYVIVLDQFSRNMFRGTPKMYQQDARALQAAKLGLEKGYDKKYTLVERVFLYMPFEHSENLASQQKSVELFTQLLADTPDSHKAIAKEYLRHAKEHRDTIQKFGRFPQRNKILGRKNTPAEEKYLQKR